MLGFTSFSPTYAFVMPAKAGIQEVAWVDRSETRVSLSLNPGYIDDGTA